MKIWCESCGASTESTIAAIKFCSSCGQQFGSSFKSISNTSFKKTVLDNNDVQEIPEIDSLDLDIQIDKEEPIKLRHEWNRGRTGEVREKPTNKPYKKPSKKQENVQKFLSKQILNKQADTRGIGE